MSILKAKSWIRAGAIDLKRYHLFFGEGVTEIKPIATALFISIRNYRWLLMIFYEIRDKIVKESVIDKIKSEIVIKNRLPSSLSHFKDLRHSIEVSF